MSLGIYNAGPLSSLLERINSLSQSKFPPQFSQVNQKKESSIEDAFPFGLSMKGEAINEAPANLELPTRETIANQANQHMLTNLVARFPELSTDLASIFDQVSQSAPPTLGRIMNLVGKQSEDNAPDLIKNLEETIREFTDRTDAGRAGKFLHSLTTTSEEQIDNFLKVNQTFLENYPPPRQAGSARQDGSAPEEPKSALVEQNPESGVYNISPSATESSPPIDHQPAAKAISIDFHLDLFYSLSQSIAETRGQGTQGNFIETTRRVSEYFEANVSLDISFMGQYLGQTETLNELDPSLLDSFFGAVKGLADFEDESLLEFFNATDNLFAALEEKFGSFGGVFDQTSEEIKSVVGGFFGSVQDLLGTEVEGPEMVELFNQVPLDGEGHNYLGSLFFNQGLFEKAILEFQQAVKEEPQNVGFLNNLGAALFKADYPDEAI